MLGAGVRKKGRRERGRAGYKDPRHGSQGKGKEGVAGQFFCFLMYKYNTTPFTLCRTRPDRQMYNIIPCLYSDHNAHNARFENL